MILPKYLLQQILDSHGHRIALLLLANPELPGLLLLHQRMVANWSALRSMVKFTSRRIQVYTGSYGRDTAISGFSDLDMLFWLHPDDHSRFDSHQGNGQSALRWMAVCKDQHVQGAGEWPRIPALNYFVLTLALTCVLSPGERILPITFSVARMIFRIIQRWVFPRRLGT